jgi:hypothetical protein
MVRFHSTNVPLFSRTGKPLNILEYLRKLSDGVAGDWDVWFRNPDDNKLTKGRICAIRKSKDAIEKSIKKLRRTASRKGTKLQPETPEYAEYVIIFTTLTRYYFGSNDILCLYRGRWQIELVFKRLKSIIEIGHLPKFNPDSSISWLYGKMFVALLTERLYQESEFFPPGDIRYKPHPDTDKNGHKKRVRSLWREYEFWFSIVQHSVVPRISIEKALTDWPIIRERLMENSRERQPKFYN